MSAQENTNGKWKSKSLSDVVEINPRLAKDELARNSLVSFIPMKCVEEESGQFAPLGDRTFSEVCKGYTPFRDGDVIFAKVTPCMENGKAAVLKGLTNGVGFGSTEFFALRPKNGLEAKYLFHFITQSNFRQNAARNMTGAVGLRRVPKSYLEQQPIPLPPVTEQRRIVAEIEKQFTRLEAGVGALKRVQANLKRYRASVLKAACEGRLVPTEAELWRKSRPKDLKSSVSRAKGILDFESSASDKKGKKPTPDFKSGALRAGTPDFESGTFETGEALLQRILAERRKNWTGRGKYKEPAVPDTSYLTVVPKGWTWAALDQLQSLLRNGISIKPNAEQGLPILRISAVRPLSVNLAEIRYLNAKASDYHDYVLNQGDLLFTRYNGNPELVGVCGLVPMLTSSLVHPDKLIRCKIVSGTALPAFVAIMANIGESRKYLAKRVRTTAGQAGISGGDLRMLPIPLPPLAEEKRIVAEVERRLSVVEEMEATVAANLQRATRLRQAILQKAFTGEL